ncbi:hypothetical protein FFLO_04078 [Filobasidium floriforme]|uniref:Apple domain-containing protein n=1 Tax=Filobasidium floriforme TaxID=5210 RepID=A0A8K0JJJ6_9TREE|nr:uncharacterized protein HD553DRAFT_343432 [Filobasidium floriforme]KAG7531852.1 hypothetical protein FFLO_04078 [Filobasidium floriforme]KAH8082671.1 hypothetical protein HD553DRAFT_343432 [Filobasidium floriforme]
MKISCWQLFPLLALPVMAESYPVCPDGEHQASTGAGFFAFRWAFGVFAAEMLEGGMSPTGKAFDKAYEVEVGQSLIDCSKKCRDKPECIGVSYIGDTDTRPFEEGGQGGNRCVFQLRGDLDYVRSEASTAQFPFQGVAFKGHCGDEKSLKLMDASLELKPGRFGNPSLECCNIFWPPR